MRPIPRLLRLLAGVAALAACSPRADRPAEGSASGDTPQADRAARQLRVTERGIGPLRAGMTLAEASLALSGLSGALVVREGADTAGCDYLEWRGGPPGVDVMVEGGRIARVEVDSGPVATAAGARVGDTEERVRSLYPGAVTVTPHKYTNGHYLTVVPASPADSAFRIVFEAENGRVTRYRAGRRPAVEYVEGCA